MSGSLFFLLGFPLAACAGFALVKYLTEGDWHRRYFHRCGHHDSFKPFHNDVCGKCGEPIKDWTEKTARWTLLGWEFKK
jgi:hypothetical protein